MEETKNKKGKTIAIVILIVLLVALGAYTTYDKLVLDKNAKNDLEETRDNLEIANREKKEANDKIKDLEKDAKETSNVEEKNYYTINLDNIANDIHVYSMGYGKEIIYAYNGEMYIADDDNDSDDDSYSYTSMNIFVSKNPTKSSKTDYTKIAKLNIKESKVAKVKIVNNFYTSDAQEFIYIIFIDGTVKRYYYGGDGKEMEGNQVLKDYKVKDLEVSCKGGWENCKSLTYKLTLLDETEKTVKEK